MHANCERKRDYPILSSFTESRWTALRLFMMTKCNCGQSARSINFFLACKMLRSKGCSLCIQSRPQSLSRHAVFSNRFFPSRQTRAGAERRWILQVSVRDWQRHHRRGGGIPEERRHRRRGSGMTHSKALSEKVLFDIFGYLQTANIDFNQFYAHWVWRVNPLGSLIDSALRVKLFRAFTTPKSLLLAIAPVIFVCATKPVSSLSSHAKESKSVSCVKHDLYEKSKINVK